MTAEALDFPDGEIVLEDAPTFFTMVPVWLTFSEARDKALRIYIYLYEHTNQARDGRLVAWPKQTDIAEFARLKDPKAVRGYIQDLVDVGALRIEEVRYQGGMRRAHRYHLRFNPPPGYAGTVSLDGYRDAKTCKTAGQPGGVVFAPTGGGKNATTGGGENNTAQPRPTTTQKKTPEAPSSPQASRTPEGPVAVSTARPAKAAAPRPAKPKRAVVKTQVRRSSQQVRDRNAVFAVLRDIPEMGQAATPLPKGLPPVLRSLIDEQLAHRTVEQLTGRVLARWHGSKTLQDAAAAGKLERAVGICVGLLKAGDCQNPRCEDGWNIDTGADCPSCEAHRERRRRARADGVPAPRREDAVPPVPLDECEGCGKPWARRLGPDHPDRCAACKPPEGPRTALGVVNQALPPWPLDEAAQQAYSDFLKENAG